MSVTSSGRSSTSSTMRCTSGLFASMDRAICFMTVVLPALGGDTMRPRWPLPIGAMRSTIRAVMLRRVGGVLEREPLVREQRREVLEAGALAGLLGFLAVHEVDPQQRRVLLVAEGRAAGALEVVALAQAELPGLLHRDVDVVLRRQVALDAQEAVALVAQVEVALDVDRLAPGTRSPGPGSLARGRSRLRPRRRRRRLPPSSSSPWPPPFCPAPGSTAGSGLPPLVHGWQCTPGTMPSSSRCYQALSHRTRGQMARRLTRGRRFPRTDQRHPALVADEQVKRAE